MSQDTLVGGPTSTATEGFPEELFTIHDNPAALRRSVATYRPMALQASETGSLLTATRVTSWVGTEGDMFRSRRASYEPMMEVAQTAFSHFVSTVETFADELSRLKTDMASLRARAQEVWSRLQTARVSLATAQAALAATAATASHDLLALGAIRSAEDTVNTAYSNVSQLESEWEECVREARHLHQELTTLATQTSASVEHLPSPPAIPDASSGRPQPLLFTQPCEAIPQPQVEGAGDDSNLALDITQTTLDVVGLVPVIGAPADLINAGIYEVRGDHVNAALSAAGAIPVAGWAATGAKLGLKGVKGIKLIEKAVSNPIGKEITSRATLTWWRLNEIPIISDATYLTLKGFSSLPSGLRNAAAERGVPLPSLPARLARDLRASTSPPEPLPLARSVGRGSHNRELRKMIKRLERRNATDIRVNQHQVDAHGRRVGINRPDLQYTLGSGKRARRYYVEFEGPDNPRGFNHRFRTKANDPRGITKLRLVK